MTLVENNNINLFKKAVKIALVLNFIMFFAEFLSGYFAHSLALIADSFDFLGDSFNYLITIYALSKSPKIRSYAAFIKGFSMLIFAIYILYSAYEKYQIGLPVPRSYLMMATSFIALLVNLFVSILLFRYKEGSSNQKSVWLCSRNDVINNFLIIIAGISIFFTSNVLPDLIAASVISILAGVSSFIIFKDVYFELKNNK